MAFSLGETQEDRDYASLLNKREHRLHMIALLGGLFGGLLCVMMIIVGVYSLSRRGQDHRHAEEMEIIKTEQVVDAYGTGDYNHGRGTR